MLSSLWRNTKSESGVEIRDWRAGDGTMAPSNEGGGSSPSPSTPRLPRMDIRPTTARNLRTAAPFKVAGALIGRLTRVGRRDPPSTNGIIKTRHVRLVSITASNYVEKVRKCPRSCVSLLHAAL